jgi:SAM-dependent methyltransferase
MLSCVECGETALEHGEDSFLCRNCGAEFRLVDGVASFFRKNASVVQDDRDRMEFWNQGWQVGNAPFQAVRRAAPEALRESFRATLEAERYPAVTWLSPETAGGRVLLNVGCGGGYEGLLFAGYGARYIGVDFAINAVRSTLGLIEAAGYTGACYQCEAERLPLRESTVDIVYTNGVLHHTPNTLDTLRELHRVLRPGGRAIIGLYATRSVAFFWYRLRAVLAGNFTRDAIRGWVDRNTEGEWRTPGRENRYTRSFTPAEFRALLDAAGFETLRIEQSQLQLGNVPVLGRFVSRLLPDRVGKACIGPFGMMLIADCRPDKR